MAAKYTVYAWRADDEGGLGVCLTEKFSPSLDYNPSSGCNARPSVKIGEFDTIEELAEVLYEDNPVWYESKENALKEAGWLLEDLEIDI